MARSDAERLEVLKTQRDELEDMLSSAVSSYKIGNREVKREDIVEKLRWVEEQIVKLTSSTAAESSGLPRNKIRFVRR